MGAGWVDDSALGAYPAEENNGFARPFGIPTTDVDRMQAFFWRHLVPAEELKVLVVDPTFQPTPRRRARFALPNPTTAPTTKPTTTASSTRPAPKFTRQQVMARLRQLALLFEDGLITEDFYKDKVAECEDAL